MLTGSARRRRGLHQQFVGSVVVMVAALLAAGFISVIAVGSLTGEFDVASTQSRREITPLFEVRSEVSAAVGVSVLLGEPGATDRYEKHEALVARLFDKVNPFVDQQERATFEAGKSSWASAGQYIKDWNATPATQRKVPAAARVDYVKLVVATRGPLDTAIGIAQQRGARNMANARRIERRSVWYLGGAALLGLIGALSVPFRLRRSVLGPLAALRAGMDILGGGNLDFRFPPQPNADMQAVTDAVDDMAKRLGDSRDELSRLAHTDALTGLPNRLHLYEFLESRMSDPEAVAVGVLVLDLDRFKEVNDTFGHHYGDELLQLVGPRLTAALRPGDFVARAGGDEFTVVMTAPPSTPSSTFVDVAERVIDAFIAPFFIDDVPLDIGVSGGLAIFPEHGRDASRVMQRADKAMYAAKRTRTALIVYDDESDNETAPRTGDLRPAAPTNT
ncbi:MAG: hypothetical protein NVS3B21_31970 [Acidimicrobiales bacterium]